MIEGTGKPAGGFFAGEAPHLRVGERSRRVGKEVRGRRRWGWDGGEGALIRAKTLARREWSDGRLGCGHPQADGGIGLDGLGCCWATVW